MELGTEEKTILHYAKKIKEYCERQSDPCRYKCPLWDIDQCYFDNLPFNWEEVDIHE